MKKLFLLFILLSLNYNYSFSQTVQTHYETPVIITSDLWATDILVSNTEPFGNLSGVAKSNGTIYLAVPDTNITADRCLVIFRSTNSGENWVNFASVQPAFIVPRVKMVRSGLDSIYCFFQIGSSVYCWNVENNNFNQFTTVAVRDFDAEAMNSGAIYIFADQLSNNDIRRYGSTNGGISWPVTGYIDANGAFCRIYKSGNGDTLTLNYYGPVLADTAKSVIRAVRYRETSPGTMAVTGSFLNVVTNTSVSKTQFQSVFYGNTIWLFWAEGLTGAIDIKAMVSVGGTSYGSEFLVAGNPNVDEYWFEARHYTTGTGGLDIAYYSDSLQAGSPTNNTDKMLYSFANLTTPSTFSAPVQFSEHPPEWSARGYIPAMIELYNTSDVGIAWVGLDGSNKRVYWDRYLAVTGVTKNQNEVPGSFALRQNYPNPFNPSTKIEFSLPKDEFVSIKVFDILGREVSVLLSKNMKAGSYDVQFDAGKLSSGVYFYRMEAGSFTETKKMMMIK